ncbi:phosphatidylserine decarboxylase family protein [Fuerstiella marisgermanici]|uniref:Phosphatidylserine decarboxylase proenzyme n=1 Tax=Fuerstiella marisgermanici TaxID=1891926 RepID=A0A1P8WKI2_9PLAN|nr:phosphatidylserine decarboxylase family protein [Fuerstiella marisgermanici]APZ94566.1 phosphatidylserine decarboxylase [Fuerstiella marisgermanici]
MTDRQSNTPDPAAGGRRELMTMDPQLKDIQPGSGVVIHIEQAWGRVRRCWLSIFRRGYVKKMEACRKGDFNPCPHPVLDPRDLKFHQNQGGWYWDREDDPFTWRDKLPFARVGLAELLLMGGGFFVAAAAFGWWATQAEGTLQVVAAILAIAAGVIGILITWFFRDPHRAISTEPGMVVSPADGKIVEIEELDHDDFIGGPAVKIGIFLSIFNVHINRTPVAGRVIGLTYKPGKYLNALRPESARENERLTVLFEETEAPYRGMVIRQITGAIARRIVCWVKPGDTLERGQQFGMIKLGSRTELLIPREDGLEIKTKLGDKVQAGSSILAKYTG